MNLFAQVLDGFLLPPEQILLVVFGEARRQHVLAAEQVVVLKDDGVDVDGQLVLTLCLDRAVDETTVKLVQVSLQTQSHSTYMSMCFCLKNKRHNLNRHLQLWDIYMTMYTHSWFT